MIYRNLISYNNFESDNVATGELRITLTNEFNNSRIYNINNGNYESFDLSKWLKNNNIEEGNYSILLELIDYIISDDFVIEESSPDNLEHRLFFGNISSEEFDALKTTLLNKVNTEVVWFSVDSFKSIVRNVYFDKIRKSLIIYLDQPLDISEISSLEDIAIYVLQGKYEEEISLSISDSSEDIVYLTGSRRTNLNNFEESLFKEKQENKEKTYGDIEDVINDTLTFEEISKIKFSENVDYSSFENHVKFGSAVAKVKNADSKITKLREKENEYDEYKTSVKPKDKIKFKQEILSIIDNLSGYEKYVYQQKYKKLTEQEFDSWIIKQEEIAETYDIQNSEFIIYSVPPTLIENDETEIFTNFLLLMGEFYDSHWVTASTMSDIYNFDMSEIEVIPDNLVSSLLKQFGVKSDISYNRNFEEYFKNEDNYKEVTNQIKKRLLFNVSNLLKMKGTRAVLEYLINVFGIPKGIFQIYEFGTYRMSKNSATYSINSYEWFLDSDGQSSIDVNVNTQNLSASHAFELAVKEFSGQSGELLNLDNGNTFLNYQNSGSYTKFIIEENGVDIYDSGYNIPNSEAWTYIGISRENNNGDIYVAQQDVGFDELRNIVTGSATFAAGYTPSTEINILNQTESKITEFRVFNDILDQEEYEAHAKNFRSTATKTDKDLISRIYFYKPVDDSGSIQSMNNENISGSLNTMDKNDFFIDEFHILSNINTPFLDEISGDNVNILEPTIGDTLSADHRTAEFDVEENLISSPISGLFISPADMENKLIVNQASGFKDLVPDDNNGYMYEMTFDDEIRKDIGKTNIVIDFNVINSLLDLFNIKFYNLLKEFVPASVDFEFGVIIKNNIINKKRAYPKRDNEGFQLYENPVNVKNDITISNVEKLNEGVKLNIQISDLSTMPSEYIEEEHVMRFKNYNSSYLKSVDTITVKSPWLNNLIKGVTNKNFDVVNDEFGGVYIEVKS